MARRSWHATRGGWCLCRRLCQRLCGLVSLLCQLEILSGLLLCGQPANSSSEPKHHDRPVLQGHVSHRPVHSLCLDLWALDNSPSRRMARRSWHATRGGWHQRRHGVRHLVPEELKNFSMFSNFSNLLHGNVSTGFPAKLTAPRCATAGRL